MYKRFTDYIHTPNLKFITKTYVRATLRLMESLHYTINSDLQAKLHLATLTSPPGHPPTPGPQLLTITHYEIMSNEFVTEEAYSIQESALPVQWFIVVANSSLSKVRCYMLDGQSSIPDSVRDFTLSHRIQNGPRIHPESKTIVTGNNN